MTDTPVTHDLEKLISLEIPPTAPKGQSRIVRFTIACMVVFGIVAVGGLVYALHASIQREDNLNTTLGCVRESALSFDVALADGIKLKLDLDIATTNALTGVAEGSDEALALAIEETRLYIDGNGTFEYPGAEAIKTALDVAVAKRREAVAGC